MTNLIYQYWLGSPGIGVSAGRENMRSYADRVGAEYRFATNPTWASTLCSAPEYYNAFEPVYNDDDFGEYDKIMFVDTDVFAVDGLEDSIFDVDISHIGFCSEPHKELSHLTASSAINTKADERHASAVKAHYGVDVHRNAAGNPHVFNSGVVVYTKEGREFARQHWPAFQRYIDVMRKSGLPKFYSLDQPYMHAAVAVSKMPYTLLPSGWNSYVHYDGESKTSPRAVIDTRTSDTKFVHVQLRGADDHDAAWHRTVVNQPVSEWALP